MKIHKTNKYTLIKPTETSFTDFFKEFNAKDFEKEHLMIDFLDCFKPSHVEIEQFSKIARTKKEGGTSFILICSSVEIDELEDEDISLVPTLIEAEDILEMDAMERDLGL